MDVEVEIQSDDGGLLGLVPDSWPPGPVRIAAVLPDSQAAKHQWLSEMSEMWRADFKKPTKKDVMFPWCHWDSLRIHTCLENSVKRCACFHLWCFFVLSLSIWRICFVVETCLNTAHNLITLAVYNPNPVKIIGYCIAYLHTPRIEGWIHLASWLSPWF